MRESSRKSSSNVFAFLPPKKLMSLASAVGLFGMHEAHGPMVRRASERASKCACAKEFVPVDDRPFTHHNFGYHGILREVRFYFEPRSSISVC